MISECTGAVGELIVSNYVCSSINNVRSMLMSVLYLTKTFMVETLYNRNVLLSFISPT